MPKVGILSGVLSADCVCDTVNAAQILVGYSDGSVRVSLHGYILLHLVLYVVVSTVAVL